jgi:multiple sugar transport system permease protein
VRGARRALRIPERALPFVLLLPSVAFLALLIVVPMVQALLLAVQGESGGFTFEHFQRMFGDTSFRDALRNTLVLLVLIVPLQIVVALAMALLVHSRFRGHAWFLYIYAIPLAISDLAAGILWLSVFTERGYLNTILQDLGLIKEPIIYLSYESVGTVLAAIVIAESWRATALVLVILIAGLQLIPRDYFEAADLFGASRLRRTIHVVLPLLRPSLQSALIIRTIFAFGTFAAVFALAGRNLPVLAGEAYTWYAVNRDEHVAAAYAIVLLGLAIVMTVVYLRVLGVREAERAR